MPRQFQIHYKRAGAEKFGVLEPHVSAPLYDKPEVSAAIRHMRNTPSVVGIAVQVENEMFNIIAFDQPALAPHSFVLGDPEPATAPVEYAGSEHGPAGTF